jgi:F0F1-type ATP synthase membrane subunit c/vacuolar-type H+-ATPase subunit K
MPFGGLLTAGIVTAVGAGIKGYNAYQASQREDEAQRRLDELSKKPYEQYSASPALQSFYSRVLSRSMNPQGMSAAEMAGAKKGIADTQATTMYNVRGASGGNLSRYISGALSPQTGTAMANLYSQSAQMRRADEARSMGMLQGATGQLQSIQDRNTQAALQRRMMAEQALGQSVLQNRAFYQQSMEGIGSDLMGGGLMMGYGAISGGNKLGGYKTTTPKMAQDALNQGLSGMGLPTYDYSNPQ